MSDQQEEDLVLKILHTADWHLGRRFKMFEPDDELKLARARLDAVSKLISLAEQQNVDAMLCAGDLFDQPDPPPEVIGGLIALLRRKERSFPIFLLPGNHDPLTTTSVYRENGLLRAQLPAYVHVVDRDDFVHPLGDRAVLYAVPCRSQSGQSDPTEKIPAREPGDQRIRIGMVHGQTFDFPSHQTTFPIAIDAAKRRGLDYLALGDTHAYKDYGEDGPPIVYPSAPEPTTFGEPEAGYAALALFYRRRGRPTVRREKIASWCWRQETCRSVEAVRELLREPDLRKTVLRLKLDLSATIEELEELEKLLREMKGSNVSHGRVGIVRIDRERVELDLTRIEDIAASLPEVMQAVVRHLQEHEPDKPDIAARAIQHLYRTVKEFR